VVEVLALMVLVVMVAQVVEEVIQHKAAVIKLVVLELQDKVTMVVGVQILTVAVTQQAVAVDQEQLELMELQVKAEMAVLELQLPYLVLHLL
jgi:hypothetical protein